MVSRLSSVLLALLMVSCVQETPQRQQGGGKALAGAKASKGAGAKSAVKTSPKVVSRQAAGESAHPKCGGGGPKPPCARAAAHGSGHECPHAAGAKDDVKTRKTSDGKTIQQAGASFSGAPTIKISQLLATPEKYAGKKVMVSGDISAMCHHRRGWFAVVAEDKSGRFVRVITVPQFLVPARSIGKRARAEGTVEVIEVDAGAARHYARGHKLGDPKAIKGAVKRVIIRATGAEFS